MDRVDDATFPSAAPLRLTWGLVIAGLLFYLVVFDLARWALRDGPHLGLTIAGEGADRRVDWVLPGTEAWEAGIRTGHAVESTIFDHADRLNADSGAVEIIRVREPGTGEVRTVMLDKSSIVLITFSFVTLSIVFVVIGIVVLLLADGNHAARALFALCFSGGIALVVAPATLVGSTWAHAIEWLALKACGAATPAFFLAFRDPGRPLRGHAQWIRLVFVVAAGALSLAYPFVVLGAPDFYSMLRLCSLGFIIISFVFGIVAAVRGARSERVQSQDRIVGLGAAIGFLPIAVLSLLPRILLGQYLVRPEIAILSVAALPAALGYAVLRHHLLGIERLLRRSLLRAGVWLVVVAAAALALTVAEPLFARLESSPIVFGILIFIAATALPWIVRQAHAVIDRRLFQDIYNYGEALLTLTSRLARTRNLVELRDDVLKSLAELLNARSVAVQGFDGAKEQSSGSMWAQTTLAEYRADSSSGVGPSAETRREFPLRLQAASAPVGYLLLGEKQNGEPYVREDLRLVETFAAGLGVTVENLQLVRELSERVRELEARTRELRASRATVEQLYQRLTVAQEEERRRIARDIHDEPLQQVFRLARWLRREADPPSVDAQVATLERVMEALRTICWTLRPPVLDDLGLADAIEGLVDDLAETGGVGIDFEADPDAFEVAKRLPEATAIALYRATQEALNNSLKHSRASRIRVRLAASAGGLRVTVRDDGIGFDPDTVGGVVTAGSGHGLGLIGMQERLRPVGGRIRLRSKPGEGTEVLIDVAANTAGARTGAPSHAAD
ncbi:MAG TPA: ATP-binding protein [Dehalococcoidia bacterium]|nr:ATP-binding protein [Dehalococcoidia bacterium]